MASNMYLFGLVHKREHFDMQVSKIEEICSVDDGVMMLELAPNYEENIPGVLQPNFFVALAERYRPRCNRVILGDQELTIPKNPDWILSCFLGEDYFYPDKNNLHLKNSLISSPDFLVWLILGHLKLLCYILVCNVLPMLQKSLVVRRLEYFPDRK